MSRIVTLQTIELSERIPPLPNRIPTLRLRLNQKSSPSMFSMAGVKKIARSFMSKLTSGNDVKLEEAASPEATQKNKEKLRKYIGAIQDDLQKRFEEASDSLEGKTPEQQEQIVAYWTAVTEFLQQVLDWLQKLFLEVIELIKQGHTIEKDALKKMFAKATDAVKQAFNNQLSVDEGVEADEMPTGNSSETHHSQQQPEFNRSTDTQPANLPASGTTGGGGGDVPTDYGASGMAKNEGSKRPIIEEHNLNMGIP